CDTHTRSRAVPNESPSAYSTWRAVGFAASSADRRAPADTRWFGTAWATTASARGAASISCVPPSAPAAESRGSFFWSSAPEPRGRCPVPEVRCRTEDGAAPARQGATTKSYQGDTSRRSNAAGRDEAPSECQRISGKGHLYRSSE